MTLASIKQTWGANRESETRSPPFFKSLVEYRISRIADFQKYKISLVV
jgi:hypothetical protein